MRIADLGPLHLSIIASLVTAVILLAIRVYVMQKVQRGRQRENRQETERLKSLVAAYRSLAGSFSPATGEHRSQIEEALGDVVLFGSTRQVELAARYAVALTRNEPVDYQPLVNDLRSDLRAQLGLEPIPATLELPAAGPSRTARSGRGEGGGRGAGGGGAGGGGAGGGAGGGGTVGSAVIIGGAGGLAADAVDQPPH